MRLKRFLAACSLIVAVGLAAPQLTEASDRYSRNQGRRYDGQYRNGYSRNGYAYAYPRAYGYNRGYYSARPYRGYGYGYGYGAGPYCRRVPTPYYGASFGFYFGY